MWTPTRDAHYSYRMGVRLSTETDSQRMAAVGANIRELRESAGESKAVAASAMGMTRQFLRGVEAGERNVSLERLFDIADHYGVKVARLLEGA
ncbi:MAG: XRE family transcriptional regulator [Mycolicibacter arupensis]|uniref:XRE family transcriptional regulator n=2 Tax=Mycolicibacter arupensis TaxID=342002 RepID=A0A5C7XZQ6_9MYCO|nr:MAG: XRE family transcriptional regulator [Mycolicibacter arupensis]